MFDQLKDIQLISKLSPRAYWEQVDDMGLQWSPLLFLPIALLSLLQSWLFLKHSDSPEGKEALQPRYSGHPPMTSLLVVNGAVAGERSMLSVRDYEHASLSLRQGGHWQSRRRSAGQGLQKGCTLLSSLSGQCSGTDTSQGSEECRPC